MDAHSPMMWPCFSLLIALVLQTLAAADVTMVSMMVPARGNLAMLQKASVRNTVTLVGQPEKAAEQPVRALQKLANDADKQLIGKTSKVKVQPSKIDKAATEPLEDEDAKDESADNEDAQDMPGATKDVKEQSGKSGDAKQQQPTKLDEEEAMKKHLMAKVDVEKGQPSKIENAAERSEVDNEEKGQPSKIENAAERSEVDNEAQDATGTEHMKDQSADTEDAQDLTGLTKDAKGQSVKAEPTRIDKEELGKTEDLNRKLSKEMAKVEDLNRQLSKEMATGSSQRRWQLSKEMEQMLIATNDAKEPSDEEAKKKLTEEVEDEKDHPSKMDNATELSKINNTAEDADAKVGDTEDAGTEKADTKNAGTENAETEGAKGVEAHEEAEIAAAKGQETENKVAKAQLAANEEAPKTNEVKEESNGTLASEDAGSEKDNHETIGDAVEEENTTDTTEASMHAKGIDVQADKQAVGQTIPTSKDVPASQKGGNHPKKVRGPGDNLSLDNAGFESLTKLKDAEQASVYIRRVLRKQGLVVSNKTGLLKYASLCSNGHGPQSFELLSKHILKVVTVPHGWAGIVRKDSPTASNPADKQWFEALVKPSTGAGLTSPLNQEGYLAVLKLRSSTEMSVFIHRVINHLSLDVNDRWGLMGIIPFYDGEKMEQSFATLTTEILGLALQPGKWVSVSPEMP